MGMSLPVPIDGFSQYLVEISRFPLLRPEEEYALAVRYRKSGDAAAAQQLALSNLRFVVKIAYEYTSYGLRVADLVQEGNIGLLMAIKKFDPHKGFRLISYAVWWIRAYIQSFILRSFSLVKIGTTQAQRKLFYKLRSAKRKLMGSDEFDSPLDEGRAHILAEKLATSAEEVVDMDLRLSSRDLSLDTPVEEGGRTHLELLAAPDNQEEIVAGGEESGILNERVKRALGSLLPREQFIITNRIMADEPMTLQEIGNHFGISRERARQLEERAKGKLRTTLQ